MEDEHDVYGGEIPDEVDGMDAEMDSQHATEADRNMAAERSSDDPAAQELREMRKRLQEMEEEAALLREMQARVEREMNAQGGAAGAGSAASREECDARSVFVGNVDYACTPEEVQQHFQSCGTVNRVTILTDKFGQPKGFAYVEFIEQEAVPNAMMLNETELHGRQLKVMAKRTNVPGLKARGRFMRFPTPYGYSGYRPRRPYPYTPVPYYGSPYGKVPRFRRPTRYRPYY
ncbi:hypothetical protein CBR_g11173 [Chara braunii]|uniref:RRM domain-containing protein n=1 Tax=Chara braunii TaxID=69332 RepID=A0A388KQN4_CHABU|nr:hypothetical protein CBR_g11173 [Chara braunii]|eukprot:GBG72243.1 hypothetical protein CBR_g11173 [Chara braunii]